MQRPSIPVELQHRLRGYEFVPETTGESGDTVFRLEATRRPLLIAKLADTDAGHRLRIEASRLAWLRGAGIPAPRVLHLAETPGQDWLLMERLPGANAAVSPERPEIKVRLIAGALRQLHALHAGTCPFDETAAVKLARAKTIIQAGAVDEIDFDDDRNGMTAAELFDDLQLLQPSVEDIVVTHGDATLLNMMLDAEGFSGFVDCGRLGRSDRYQDLALACDSISFHLGADWVAPFLQAYGLASVDQQRMRFYLMLDEFF
jgi:aminoglycoside 3'-phosphotransferase-2